MSLLEAEGLEFSYRETPVLRDVDLSLGAGEVLGLIGPNGAGKTSLLRLLAGLAVPEQGVVNWDGQSLAGLSGKTLARLLAYMPQGAPAHWPLTVERVVELGRIPHRSWWQGLSAADSEAVSRAMAQADVERLRHRVVTTLSGGERARVMLARVLATGSRVILADEPVASLDPFHQLQVMRNLREHADGGGAVLVVLHDLNLAAHFCDRLVLLDLGAVACEGPAREVLENPLLEAVYAVRIDVTEAFGLPWVRFR